MSETGALESLVTKMTLGELSMLSGKSVEDIVAFALKSGGVPPRRDTKPARKAKVKTRARKVIRKPKVVETRSQSGREAFDATVLSVVAKSRKPLAAADIRAKVGGTPAQVRTSLQRLCETRKVKVEGRARSTRYRT